MTEQEGKLWNSRAVQDLVLPEVFNPKNSLVFTDLEMDAPPYQVTSDSPLGRWG